MNTPPQRRYQFSLRMMLVLVTLICILLAWVGHSLNWIRQRHQFLDREHPILITTTNDWSDLSAPSALWVFGEQGVPEIECSQREEGNARRLFPEARVRVRLGWG